MKLSFSLIKINRFDSFSGFTHASSPRYFKNNLGKIEQYDFTKKDDLQKYNIHMIQFMKMVQVEKKIPYLLNQVHSDQIFVLKDVSQTHEPTSLEYRLEFLQRIVFRFLFVIRSFKWLRRSMQGEKEPAKAL